MTDAATIHAARQGDAAAWATLVQEHQQAVFRLAYLFLHDASDAEDVAQDVFIQAFRHLASFDSSRPLRPWLLHIAANVARNRQRSWRRYWAALQRAWRSDPSTYTANPDRIGPQWESEQLHLALQQLRPAEREIIYARYFLELSEGDTATVLNIAQGTVKSRLHRAIQRLRTIIDTDFSHLREDRHE